MLAVRVEKPPVDIVENEWQTESNQFIPPRRNKPMSRTVKII